MQNIELLSIFSYFDICTTRYQALFKYVPQSYDELALEESDLISITEICCDGWMVGENKRTGKFGTFPGNYVQAVFNFQVPYNNS